MGITTKNMSKEYTLALALVAASVLKVFGIELESGVLEGLIAGVVALGIAFFRHSKGDINIVGAKLQ